MMRIGNVRPAIDGRSVQAIGLLELVDFKNFVVVVFDNFDSDARLREIDDRILDEDLGHRYHYWGSPSEDCLSIRLEEHAKLDSLSYPTTLPYLHKIPTG